MVFNKVIGMTISQDGAKVVRRDAVKAVIMRDNMLLMIYTNKGDYKFPGGGNEKGENHQETLIREIQEETGYHAEAVKEMIGMVVERKIDKFDSTMLFEMDSYYYLCDISDIQDEQKLDSYEIDLDFKAVWISIEDAILKNQDLLDNHNESRNDWVERELYVLRELKDHFI